MTRLALLATLAMLATPATGEPLQERQDELIYRLRQDCGSCHGLTLKGGLGPPLLPSHVAKREDEHLVEVILDGIPSTPMPPWAFEISRGEAEWLVRRLKAGLDDGS